MRFGPGVSNKVDRGSLSPTPPCPPPPPWMRPCHVFSCLQQRTRTAQPTTTRRRKRMRGRDAALVLSRCQSHCRRTNRPDSDAETVLLPPPCFCMCRRPSLSLTSAHTHPLRALCDAGEWRDELGLVSLVACATATHMCRVHTGERKKSEPPRRPVHHVAKPPACCCSDGQGRIS